MGIKIEHLCSPTQIYIWKLYLQPLPRVAISRDEASKGVLKVKWDC